MLSHLSPGIRQYLVVTGNYWAFTLTDGALRMLVVLHFHDLGYSPLEIALLFLFYEIFGVITNLVGGWLGAHIGLNRTMSIGLALQVIALAMLLVPATLLSVPWVMAAQALSGIAKDLNKMSAKSSIKLLVPAGEQGTALQVGGHSHRIEKCPERRRILPRRGAADVAGFYRRGGSDGRGPGPGVARKPGAAEDRTSGRRKPSRSFAIFSPRVAPSTSSPPPACCCSALAMSGSWWPCRCSWRKPWAGTTARRAASSPSGSSVTARYRPWRHASPAGARGSVPDGRSATAWAAGLAIVPVLLALGLGAGINPTLVVVGGLLLFGVLFAINSSLHSYLIVSYAGRDGVSLDVGFYYMANAMGRLTGTVLSGWVFQLAGQGVAGLAACLWISAGMLIATVIISLGLPTGRRPAHQGEADG